RMESGRRSGERTQVRREGGAMMSLADTLTKRRPSKSDTSLAIVLAAPLPADVDAIRADLSAALAAFDHAKRAMNDAMSENTAMRLQAAETKLRRLEVSSDVAGPLGTGAPSAEEIAVA